MGPPKPQAGKRSPLTLAQLAAYDDILTDALVDHVYYWTTIPKNRPSYHPSRGVPEETIAKILQEELVLNRDPEAAVRRLLQVDGLRRFHTGLKTDKEKEDFRRHLRRYVNIYLPDCPWEVSSTNRYTIVTHEASVTARRSIKRNETVKYLSGIQVTITPDEEEAISVRKKDFSIVVSSRSKSTSLFMGPARFANHDCKANAALVTTGHAGIEIVAIRTIEVGEEITVTYGDSYFGEDNCECLCKTCEDAQRNGWESETAPIKIIADDERLETYALRKRRRDSSMADSSRAASVSRVMRPKISKGMLKSSLSQDLRDYSIAPSPCCDAPQTGEKRGRSAMVTPPITPAKKVKHFLVAPDELASVSRGSSVSTGSSTTHPTAETGMSTPEQDLHDEMATKDRSGIEGELHASNGDKTALPLDCTGGLLSPRSDTSKTMHCADSISEDVVLCPPHIDPHGAGLDTIASIAPSIEIVEKIEDDVGERTTREASREQDSEDDVAGRARVPGDYVLTPLLLSEPEMAWVNCSICSSYFVQQDAYFTRSACPRCERHSKLYGYMWPKTDRSGPSDKEERILDHRTVHRFLDPNDERRVRGHKRQASVDLDDGGEAEEMPRGRKVKRGSAKPSPKKQGQSMKDTNGWRRSGRARRASSRLVEA